MIQEKLGKNNSTNGPIIVIVCNCMIIRSTTMICGKAKVFGLVQNPKGGPNFEH